ncbi:MetQ/NlpA family ABC transporter substrate-binding protein [Gordonia soli]|uniref:Putative ABC transporter substrate-binding protein n=1 Tax=Gordonia soli NBRC 108243 TaxID=1223545 RepID=M0QLA9_9ACTN|nr:MetQ/NlpA family ABC transporter substrate-binding protein [Gordonia soli]GAC68197.1 putative ABC transporter substrate-binding protein [Gordonia soli NBRC 108243]
MRRSRLSILVVLVALIGMLTACGSSGDSSTVRIGVADASENYWNVFKQKASADGIDVELVNFTDYNQPNPALAESELDLNEFQHLLYLATYNAKNNQNLVPIGATAVYPLPLYSTKHKSVGDIPQGGQVVVPNDPTNLARALLVLEQAKLITLKTPGSAFSTVADIDTGASKVKVVAVDAGQTAANLDSADAAIVNNNYATSAKLTADQVIASDDPNSDGSKPYINAFVARDADKNNETYLKLAKIYHDPEVEKAVKESLGDSGVLKTNSAADLQKTTKDLEAQVKSSGA